MKQQVGWLELRTNVTSRAVQPLISSHANIHTYTMNITYTPTL